MKHWRWVACLVFILLASQSGWAQADMVMPELKLPDIKIEPKPGLNISPNLQVMMLMTSLSLIPYFVVTCTAYIRVSIALSYIKAALGSTQALSNQLMMGVCLIMTFSIMYPVGQRVNETALQPYMKGQIEQEEFFEKGIAPVKDFMLYQTREQDLITFLRLGGFKKFRIDLKRDGAKDVPFVALYPAFIMSEVKTGFMIGFLIYLPFLVVDMIVAATLMSMGMFMISPSSISVPFKLLLWVSIDGWHILIKALLGSFHNPPWMERPPL